MKAFSQATLTALVLLAAMSALPNQAQAGFYSSYSYYPSRGYYYSYYHYKPYPTYPSYHRHYVVSFPHSPRYLYYYNPYRKVYWGRYDLEGKGYCLLSEEHRKQSLKDIPESAFPPPGEMPPVPESTDGSRLEVPPPPPKQ